MRLEDAEKDSLVFALLNHEPDQPECDPTLVCSNPDHLAAEILASDWLAAYTAEAERRGARAVLAAVEAAWANIPNTRHPGTGGALLAAACAAAEQTGGDQ